MGYGYPPLYYRGRGGGWPGYTSTPKIAKKLRKIAFSAGFYRRIRPKILSAPYANPLESTKFAKKGGGSYPKGVDWQPPGGGGATLFTPHFSISCGHFWPFFTREDAKY